LAANFESHDKLKDEREAHAKMPSCGEVEEFPDPAMILPFRLPKITPLAKPVHSGNSSTTGSADFKAEHNV
jgi:hypothetical protein